MEDIEANGTLTKAIEAGYNAAAGKDYEPMNSEFRIRLALASDIPMIRKLVNQAYKELADMGLNYTATCQDEAVTQKRMSEGRTFLLESNGELVGTILLTVKNYFTHSKTAYISQFAIHPSRKRLGLGSILMDLCEQISQKEGFEGVQLDTAKPASHLVKWYLKRGYQIVGETHWEGKNYDTWIFEKRHSVIQNDLEPLKARDSHLF